MSLESSSWIYFIQQNHNIMCSFNQNNPRRLPEIWRSFQIVFLNQKGKDKGKLDRRHISDAFGRVLSSLSRLVVEVSLMKLHSSEYHSTFLMISQRWFRKWPGALRQQATIWANVYTDLCRQMVSLGHSELTNFLLFLQHCFQHCFVTHFTPQYPQLTCLSTQPLYSH